MNQSAPFGLSLSPPSLMISGPGGSTTAMLTVTASAGFNGTINLSCSVVNNGQGTTNNPPACSLNPAQLNLSAPNSGNVTVLIGPMASRMALSRPGHGSKGRALFGATGGFVVAAIFAGFPARQRLSRKALLRSLRLSAFILVICLTLLLAPSCGGGGSTKNLGTSEVRYTVTLNANSGIYATSISIPLTVQ
jgi:hypothetical protein